MSSNTNRRSSTRLQVQAAVQESLKDVSGQNNSNDSSSSKNSLFEHEDDSNELGAATGASMELDELPTPTNENGRDRNNEKNDPKMTFQTEEDSNRISNRKRARTLSPEPPPSRTSKKAATLMNVDLDDGIGDPDFDDDDSHEDIDNNDSNYKKQNEKGTKKNHHDNNTTSSDPNTSTATSTSTTNTAMAKLRRWTKPADTPPSAGNKKAKDNGSHGKNNKTAAAAASDKPAVKAGSIPKRAIADQPTQSSSLLANMKPEAHAIVASAAASASTTTNTTAVSSSSQSRKQQQQQPSQSQTRRSNASSENKSTAMASKTVNPLEGKDKPSAAPSRQQQQPLPAHVPSAGSSLPPSTTRRTGLSPLVPPPQQQKQASLGLGPRRTQIMNRLSQLCQSMRQHQSNRFALGNVHTIDLSGSFLRPPPAASSRGMGPSLAGRYTDEGESSSYDFFDLNAAGEIIIPPRIPMFPEDLSPGRPEHSLHWWGIQDPALGDGKFRPAPRVADPRGHPRPQRPGPPPPSSSSSSAAIAVVRDGRTMDPPRGGPPATMGPSPGRSAGGGRGGRGGGPRDRPPGPPMPPPPGWRNGGGSGDYPPPFGDYRHPPPHPLGDYPRPGGPPPLVDGPQRRDWQQQQQPLPLRNDRDRPPPAQPRGERDRPNSDPAQQRGNQRGPPPGPTSLRNERGNRLPDGKNKDRDRSAQQQQRRDSGQQPRRDDRPPAGGGEQQRNERDRDRQMPPQSQQKQKQQQQQQMPPRKQAPPQRQNERGPQQQRS